VKVPGTVSTQGLTGTFSAITEKNDLREATQWSPFGGRYPSAENKQSFAIQPYDMQFENKQFPESMKRLPEGKAITEGEPT